MLTLTLTARRTLALAATVLLAALALTTVPAAYAADGTDRAQPIAQTMTNQAARNPACRALNQESAGALRCYINTLRKDRGALKLTSTGRLADSAASYARHANTGTGPIITSGASSSLLTVDATGDTVALELLRELMLNPRTRSQLTTATYTHMAIARHESYPDQGGPVAFAIVLQLPASGS